MDERVGDIVDRLRGIYVIAVDMRVGLLNGSNRFIRNMKETGWKQPPIQEEAAKEIERLREIVAKYEKLERINFFNEQCDLYGIP